MTSKTLKSIFSVLGILLLVSCVKSKETESTPYCAITSFGVNSIVSYVPYKTSTGTTTVKRTVSGSSILFQINQETGLISTVKSLPNWINLTKVVPTFTCHGTLQYKSGDNYYTKHFLYNEFHKPTEQGIPSCSHEWPRRVGGRRSQC